MSEWLSQFLVQPGASAPWANGNHPLYCIIDRVRQPKALEQLYQQDGVAGLERLFQDTPFAALNDIGPLWLPITRGTALASKAIELCRVERSGILITCETPAKGALVHARRLLRMNSKSHGDSLARFYDPAFWSALALTTDAQKLHGPWLSVYTPPANPDDSLWRAWHRPENLGDTPSEESYPLCLESNTLAASKEIRCWYWLRARHPESANELRDEQLPLLLDNINLLVSHGIEEGRHLERMLLRMSLCSLRGNVGLMKVLNSDRPAFEKIPELEV